MPEETSIAVRLRVNPHAAGLVLALAAFLANFDVTAVVVAMPSISRDLDLGIAGFAWVMDAYSLSFTSALLTAGVLADRMGRRRALLAGNCLFMVASLACGLAWDGPTLWAARAFQGIGAAFVITVAFALLANIYVHPTDRARAFGLVGVVSGISMALGPTLGGAVAAWLHWRGIFLINIPICAVIAWAVPRLVDETQDLDGRDLDVFGIALLTVVLGLMIASLIQHKDFPAYATVGMAASVALIGCFIIQQKRRVEPLFDLTIFANPVMLGIFGLLFAVSFGYWAVLVYLPLFLQMAFGWPPHIAGFALFLATGSMLVVPLIGSRLATRWGWRRLFATSLAIMCLGDILLTCAAPLADGRSGLSLIILGMMCVGTGAALAHPQLSSAVVTLVPLAQAGMASAITVVARQAGFAIGIAALGAVLPHETTAADFAAPFLLAAIFSAAGFAAAWTLLPAHTRNASARA